MSIIDINYMTEKRKEKMKAVLKQRLAKLTVVLDNIFDEHNISAVLRSCEAFGVQDVHVIESTEEFNVNIDISQKAEKWLTIHKWTDFKSCKTYLKKNGFVTYATCFAQSAISVDCIPLEKSIALVFGNEHRGINKRIIDDCDKKVIIPMVGFVESLNISVAAAVAISHLSTKLRKNDNENVFIDEKRKNVLYNEWVEWQLKSKSEKWKAKNGKHNSSLSN